MKNFIISKNILVEDTNTYQMTLQTTEVPNSGRTFQNHITASPPIATYIKAALSSAPLHTIHVS